MRSFLIAVAGLMLFANGAAKANVSITVDKNAQIMTVAVNGVERYQWPVSTGIPSVPNSFAFSMLAGTVLTVLATIFPAIKAAQLPPAAALRSEI